MNTHHGGTQAHTRHYGVEYTFVLTGIVRYVGRSTAHIETNNVVKALVGRHARHTDDTACRAGKNRVFTLKSLSVCEATVGLHELQTHTRQGFHHALDIATQYGRKISIYHGRIATRHKTNKTRGFVRYRHLRKACFARQLRQLGFVLVIAITMHQHNGNRSKTLGSCGLQALAGGLLV